MKILVLEDDEDQRYILGDILKEHETRMFKRYADAVKLLDDSVDLVITDLNLHDSLKKYSHHGEPEVVFNGANFITRCRKKLGDEIPILVVTANSEGSEIVDLAMKAGADHLLCKPFGPNDLIGAIEETIVKKKAEMKRRAEITKEARRSLASLQEVVEKIETKPPRFRLSSVVPLFSQLRARDGR